jgi:hypothetical protein
MILDGASPRLHPAKTLTTRTIIDLSLPRVIERSDAPILNLSPKEQIRVHNLINDPRTADDRVFGIRTSKTRAPYISNTMVEKARPGEVWDTQLFFLIEFAPIHGSPFKPERLLKGETRKRRDLFPRCKRFFLDRTPLSHGSFHSASLSAGGAPERAVT